MNDGIFTIISVSCYISRNDHTPPNHYKYKMARVLGNDVKEARRSHTDQDLKQQSREGSIQFYDDGTQSFFWFVRFTLRFEVAIASICEYTPFQHRHDDGGAILFLHSGTGRPSIPNV